MFQFKAIQEMSFIIPFYFILFVIILCSFSYQLLTCGFQFYLFKLPNEISWRKYRFMYPIPWNTPFSYSMQVNLIILCVISYTCLFSNIGLFLFVKCFRVHRGVHLHHNNSCKFNDSPKCWFCWMRRKFLLLYFSHSKCLKFSMRQTDNKLQLFNKWIDKKEKKNQKLKWHIQKTWTLFVNGSDATHKYEC